MSNSPIIKWDLSPNTSQLPVEDTSTFNYSNQMNSVSPCGFNLPRNVMFLVTFFGLICADADANNPSISFSKPSFEVVSPYIYSFHESDKTEEDILKENLKEEVSDLAKLKDNWDGEGANRVSTQSIEHALNILEHKNANIQKVSCVYANRNGFVSLQWEDSKGQIIGIELGRKKMSYFVTLKEKSYYHNAELINDDNLRQFYNYLSRI